LIWEKSRQGGAIVYSLKAGAYSSTLVQATQWSSLLDLIAWSQLVAIWQLIGNFIRDRYFASSFGQMDDWGRETESVGLKEWSVMVYTNIL